MPTELGSFKLANLVLQPQYREDAYDIYFQLSLDIECVPDWTDARTTRTNKEFLFMRTAENCVM